METKKPFSKLWAVVGTDQSTGILNLEFKRGELTPAVWIDEANTPIVLKFLKTFRVKGSFDLVEYDEVKREPVVSNHIIETYE